MQNILRSQSEHPCTLPPAPSFSNANVNARLRLRFGAGDACFKRVTIVMFIGSNAAQSVISVDAPMAGSR